MSHPRMNDDRNTLVSKFISYITVVATSYLI